CFFCRLGHPRALHSFPTRRSSDLPSYAKIGALAGVLLLLLRLIQGLCLGGEYGGAITYVAEYAPDEKRGYYTGWLQTSPTLGIVDRKSTRLNSSHQIISYAVFCLK